MEIIPASITAVQASLASIEYELLLDVKHAGSKLADQIEVTDRDHFAEALSFSAVATGYLHITNRLPVTDLPAERTLTMRMFTLETDLRIIGGCIEEYRWHEKTALDLAMLYFKAGHTMATIARNWLVDRSCRVDGPYGSREAILHVAELIMRFVDSDETHLKRVRPNGPDTRITQTDKATDRLASMLRNRSRDLMCILADLSTRDL